MVEVDGVRLHLEERGAGSAPPALLAHGLGGNREVWSKVADTLARGRRVFAYDLRGHGRSARELDDYGLERYARDLLAIRGAVSPDEPPHLVAASLSGLAAQIVAVKRDSNMALSWSRAFSCRRRGGASARSPAG